MQILLVGNGFDIEHGLPTKYSEFLEFCTMTRRIYTSNKSILLDDYINSNDDLKININIKKILFNAFEKRSFQEKILDGRVCGYNVKTSNDILNELYTLINHNAWLEYFLNSPSYIGETWIDFESEIARVIKVIDDIIVLTNRNMSLNNLVENKDEVINVILKCSEKSVRDAFGDFNAINKFITFLNVELGRLIRAFEIYIAEFVNKIPVAKKSLDIVKLNPDHVLSFNYSNTYERIYGQKKKIEYGYIHGKADIKKNINSSNLILGIDEYLDNDRKNTELELIMFKKFYQRIYKSTSNTYLSWLDEIRSNYACKHNLFIFGHSLDVTDKDVLKLFICNDNVHTKIFFYRKDIDDKTMLGKLISNLVRIIGQEELIRRTGGNHRTIEFIPQNI